MELVRMLRCVQSAWLALTWRKDLLKDRMIDFIYVFGFFILGLLGRIGWLSLKVKLAEKKIINQDLERKEKENELKVINDNAGRSDADIVGDIFKSAKRKPDSD